MTIKPLSSQTVITVVYSFNNKKDRIKFNAYYYHVWLAPTSDSLFTFANTLF